MPALRAASVLAACLTTLLFAIPPAPAAPARVDECALPAHDDAGDLWLGAAVVVKHDACEGWLVEPDDDRDWYAWDVPADPAWGHVRLDVELCPLHPADSSDYDVYFVPAGAARPDVRPSDAFDDLGQHAAGEQLEDAVYAPRVPFLHANPFHEPPAFFHGAVGHFGCTDEVDPEMTWASGGRFYVLVHRLDDGGGYRLRGDLTALGPFDPTQPPCPSLQDDISFWPLV